MKVILRSKCCKKNVIKTQPEDNRSRRVFIDGVPDLYFFWYVCCRCEMPCAVEKITVSEVERDDIGMYQKKLREVYKY